MKEPTRMSDLELTKACAEAMGYIPMQAPSGILTVINGSHEFTYQPLHDDAQAMALVKKFEISIRKIDPDRWDAWIPLLPADGSNADLNRAIVECVAKMASVVEAK